MKWIVILLLIPSCSNHIGVDEISLKVRYIDSIIKENHSAMMRVMTDTMQIGNDSVYTSYYFDDTRTLKFIVISEPSENLQYVSHFHNDSLLNVSVESPDVNYISDEAAAYYLANDSIIFKREPRGKLKNIQKLIADQKENAKKFNQQYKPRIAF
jgi:hypothetical protein